MNNIDDYNHQRCYNYNNYLSKQEFKERGVTIMSLVITIIVLLILAGITIKLALNDNGIIKQSKLASEEYQNKALQEQFALNQISKEIENVKNQKFSWKGDIAKNMAFAFRQCKSTTTITQSVIKKRAINIKFDDAHHF